MNTSKRAKSMDYKFFYASRNATASRPFPEETIFNECGNLRGENFESIQFLTRNEVATLLNVSLRTVDNWIQGKAIQVVKIGRSIRITKSALDDFIQCRTLNSRK